MALLAAGGGGWYLFQVGSNYQQPTVQSVDNSFGRVTNETSVIHSEVVLNNPNEGSLPATATIEYVVAMNGIEVATGTKRGVRLESGRNVVAMNATLDNSKIPAWWVTHVDNDETTVITTSGRVSVDGLPIGFELPTRRQRIETDLLGALANTSDRRIAVDDEPLLVVTNQSASWGEATAERTPARFTVDLENVHDHPIRLDGTVYEVRMNGVLVGNGTTEDSIRLSPGESGEFATRVTLDPEKMQAWWVRHLRDDQTTRFTVEIHGIVVDDGERTRVPLSVYETRGRFGTDMFGDGGTTVERLPPESDEAFARPEVVDVESRWGAVTDGSTAIVTSATVSNPNTGRLGGFLDVRVHRTTDINGVEVASGSTTIQDLAGGTTTHTLTSRMAHDTVPRWWARHLDNGERSTVRTTTNGSVDVGVTTLPVDVPDRSSTVETELLRGLNNDTARSVESEGGRTLLTIERTAASWGDATPDRVPLTVRMTVRNGQSTPATLRDISYRIGLNDVVLANGTDDGTYVIAPHEQRTIELTIDVDNSKMAAWWPTHVRNDERSVLHTRLSATVESGGLSERVEFDALSSNTTVETDMLGNDSSGGTDS